MRFTTGHRPALHGQRGFSLVESLVAFGVVAFGMLGVAQMNAAAVGANAEAKTRAAALDLADQRIEEFRNITTAADYAALADSNTAESIAYSEVSFSRTWTVNKLTTAGAPRYARAAVTVGWQDSDGADQSVTLNSNIAEPVPLDMGKWYAPALKEAAEDEAAAGPTGGQDETIAQPTEGGSDGVTEEGLDGGTETVEETDSCTSEQIIGSVIAGSRYAKADWVWVNIGEGACSDVTGTTQIATFSCTVACTGTVTLGFDTDQSGYAVTPATQDVVLDTHEATDIVDVVVVAAN